MHNIRQRRAKVVSDAASCGVVDRSPSAGPLGCHEQARGARRGKIEGLRRSSFLGRGFDTTRLHDLGILAFDGGFRVIPYGLRANYVLRVSSRVGPVKSSP